MKPSEILTAVQTAIEAIPEPEGVSPDDKLRVATNPSRVRRAGRLVEVGIGGSRRVPGRMPCAKPEHEVYVLLAVAYPDNPAGMAVAADDAALVAEALHTLPNLHGDLVAVEVEVGDIGDFDQTTIVSTRQVRVVYKYGS